MAMFPVFIVGCVAGFFASYAYFTYIKTIPSNTKFKLQEEQLKNARIDLQMFEAELEKAKQQIEVLTSKQAKSK